MKRETIIWTVVLALGAAALIGRAAFTRAGMANAYVKAVPVAVDTAHPQGRWTKYETSTPGDYRAAVRADPNQDVYRFSMPRSVGIWVAAMFTLFIFSFAYKDNPFYKFAEAVLIGVSAAYWMVIGFWSTIVPNLIGRLAPGVTKAWALPGLEGKDTVRDLWYLVPLILGVMLLWRLAPKGAWIARWPLAFIIGTTAGVRLIGFIQADFLSQIRASIVSLAVRIPQIAADGSTLVDAGGQPMLAFDFWQSFSNLIIVIGVLCCLVYFFFSFEHKGIVGKTARLGIWFLMITFGAGFGYTVMGRIALLSQRLEFLFDDWLWLIDPKDLRSLGMLG